MASLDASRLVRLMCKYFTTVGVEKLSQLDPKQLQSKYAERLFRRVFVSKSRFRYRVGIHLIPRLGYNTCMMPDQGQGRNRLSTTSLCLNFFSDKSLRTGLVGSFKAACSLA